MADNPPQEENNDAQQKQREASTESTPKKRKPDHASTIDQSDQKNEFISKISVAGLLISVGIVFGDIGTSPLYVLKAIVHNDTMTQDLVLGGLSCVFWTLTIQTSLKYVFLTLRADNNGEGGLLALYALVRKQKKWLTIPGIIGTCALLADGLITPPISVTSAIEGLRYVQHDIPVIPIVIAILAALFIFQQFGTQVVGKAFGPIMVVWFLFLGVMGSLQITNFPAVFKALNPYYAYDLLVKYPGGFWLLGGIFLCTTGAEALYSDLGHCGRKNIQVSWIYVKTALLLNYFGQGAWMMTHIGEQLNGRNPFYFILPDWMLMPGIILATIATIIASQALISGSYTLIKEAMGLHLWPNVKIAYPTALKGQLYIPSVNWLMLIGCVGIVLFFQKSENMEGAYGLTITITMITTTLLLSFYLHSIKAPLLFSLGGFILFLSVESSFLVANLQKIANGGWLTLTITIVLSAIMFIWLQGTNIKRRYTSLKSIEDYLPMFKDLSEDESVPKFATHLIYLTQSDKDYKMEQKVLFSIFNKNPKRADVYWFIHVNEIDHPNTKEYEVVHLVPGKVIMIQFHLGFRVAHKINLYFRRIFEDMGQKDEVDIKTRYSSLKKYDLTGDFRFVLIETTLTRDYDLEFKDQVIMDLFSILEIFNRSPVKTFELDESITTTEKVPLIISGVREWDLKRIDQTSEAQNERKDKNRQLQENISKKGDNQESDKSSKSN